MLQAKVEDIYVIPDYASWIKDYIDPDLAQLHKEEYTKLQWIFEYIQPCKFFPFGVKTLYRDFSSDRVCIIREVPKGSAATIMGQHTGLEAYALPIKNHPTAEAFPDRNVEGFYLLSGDRLPCTRREKWKPEPFSEGTQAEFESVQSGIYNFYPIGHPKRSDWTKWFNEWCPMTDDVNKYLESHAFIRPLQVEFDSATILRPDWLIHGASPHYTVSAELTDRDWIEMSAAVTQDSVACRFNTHPPPPVLFFANGGDHVTTFLENAISYYSVMLSTFTNKLLMFYLR